MDLKRSLHSKSAHDLGLLLVRLGFGLAMFFGHGLSKATSVFQGNFEFGNPIGLGPEISLILSAFAEALCALLVVVGFKTRVFLIPLIINMAVAFFIVHADDPFSRAEKSFLFLFVWLGLFLTGPGRYSVDGAFGSGSRS